MFKFFKFAEWKTFGLLCAIVFCLPGFVKVAEAQKPAPTPASSASQRPKKQKLQAGAGFERYAGQGADSRLIQGGATRGPLRAIAPLEGLAYRDRPLFMWDPAPGVKSYLFELHDEADSTGTLVYKTDVAAAQLVYPSDAPPLMPGKLYSWRVSIPAVLGRRNYGSSVNFSVLSIDDAKPLKDALQKAQLTTTAPRTAKDLLRAADVFKQYGIWYDALRSVSEILNKTPDDMGAKTFYEEMRKQLNLEQEKMKAAAKP